MALSSNLGFLNDTQDNYANGSFKYALLTEPVMAPQSVQSNIPWKYEKIELIDSFVYKVNNIIQFKFPRNGLVDPRSLRLSFNVRALITNSGGPSQFSGSFCWDINSVFSRCTLKCGQQQVITDIQPYNLFSRTISRLANEHQSILTQRGNFLGLGPGTTLYGLAAQNSRFNYHNPGNGSVRPQPLAEPRRYMVPINQGLFAQQKPIYLDAFHDDLVLEFTLDNPTTTAYLSQTNNAITSTNVRITSLEIGCPTLHYTRHIPVPELQLELDAMLANARLSYQFHAHDYFRFPIAARQKRYAFEIPISRQWMKYAVAVIRCDTDRDASQWSALRTYACVDPNTNSSLAGPVLVPNNERWAKQSAIQHYYWRYGSETIPPQPVRVSNAVPIIYDANGVPINVASDATVDDFTFPTTRFNHVTPAVEAWYMVEQLFLKHKELQLSMCPAQNESCLEVVDPGTPYINLIGCSEEGDGLNPVNFGLAAGAGTNGRVSSNFMMVGLFSESGYDGTTMAMSGGLENESLQLHFECVGISDNPVPETNMFLEVFVAYDNIMQLTDNGLYLTN